MMIYFNWIWQTQTHDPTYYKDLNTEAPVSPQGTTHMSVVDKDRNSVALTSTVRRSAILSPSVDTRTRFITLFDMKPSLMEQYNLTIDI